MKIFNIMALIALGIVAADVSASELSYSTYIHASYMNDIGQLEFEWDDNLNEKISKIKAKYEGQKLNDGMTIDRVNGDTWEHHDKRPMTRIKIRTINVEYSKPAFQVSLPLLGQICLSKYYGSYKYSQGIRRTRTNTESSDERFVNSDKEAVEVKRPTPTFWIGLTALAGAAYGAYRLFGKK